MMWQRTIMSAWSTALLLLGARPAAAAGRRPRPAFQPSPGGGRSVHRRIRIVHPLPRVESPPRSRVRRSSGGGGALHSSDPRKTLQGSDIYAAEEVVKKSRFIGYAARCESWDDAKSILESVRGDHPKSRHVCFGFVSSSGAAGDGGAGTERCTDDGEPTGTAGAPILGAIKGEGLSDVLCVVVRYFGGVKLGAGGLIRAYGGAARLVLRSAPTEVHVPKTTIRVATRAANSGAVYAAAAKFGGATSGETYNDRGELEVAITCDEVDGEGLRQAIVDGTRGGVMFL